MLPRDKGDFPKMLQGIKRLVSKKASPERVIATVVNLLIKNHYPLLPRLAAGSASLAKAEIIGGFSQWLGQMDVKDIGFWLSSTYAHLVNPDRRKHRAMFFTPPVFGGRMLDDLEHAGVNWTTAHIIDIACGGAAFLAPAARCMAEALAADGASARTILAHVQTHLTGIEIESFLAKLSRFFIGVTLYPWIEEARRVPVIRLLVGDALHHSTSLIGRFDAVICNPPYRKLTRAEVNVLPAHLRELCFCQPNLYAMFMALSARLLNEKGVAGLLTPMSFLSGQSFLRLRKHLAETRQIERIDLVEERTGVFLGVEQNTAITVLAPKKKRSGRTEVFVGVGAAGWRPAGKIAIDDTGGPWVLPRCAEDAKLLAVANGHTVAGYGYATAVGDVVLFRDKRRRYATLEAARHAKAMHPVPMLRAPEIRPDGTLEFQRNERPDCFIDAGTSEKGVIRGAAVALQRVTSPDQPRRLICASVPANLQCEHDGVMGENHVTFLVAGNDATVKPELLARILGSEPVDRLFRCRSGANNVSAYELAHVPLPDPEVVRTALAAGATIDASVRAGFGIPDPATNKPKKHGPTPRQIHRPSQRP